MFYQKLAKIHNSGQSHSLILCGNVYDLFWNGKTFEPLIPFLCTKVSGLIQVVYEINGPIRIIKDEKDVENENKNKDKLRAAWIEWKTGMDENALAIKDMKTPNRPTAKIRASEFDDHLISAIGNPERAMEFLRQLALCSRQTRKENLFIIVEGADMLLPTGNGDVSSLNDKQLHRISIIYDWISDPNFINGNDTVVFIAESKSLIHPRISRLPHVTSIQVPSPDLDARKLCLGQASIKNIEEIAQFTAGLTIYALQALTKIAVDGVIPIEETIKKVEEFIQSQLGEDVVEFKRPTHTLKDCVGNKKLIKFLETVLIPRLRNGADSLPGAVAAGPIGGGKTYVFEALAAMLNMPVLLLKNLRSMWFGQTDVIAERLERLLEVLYAAGIFVDEADLAFGGLGEGVHETEKRLTGRIQTIMSDPRFRGRIFWLLMTARIHRLSPDMRRPGRVGDLIIPILDPEGEDRKDFIKWMLRGIVVGESEVNDNENENIIAAIDKYLPKDCSAASFSSLRSNLKFRKKFATEQDLLFEVRDFIQPAIAKTRRYQTLQALMNCTRRSLLPAGVTDKDRENWEQEVRQLELQGIN